MIIRDAGYLMLGSRLKRLGDKVLSEVRTVYQASGVEFETPWFPIFYVLKKNGSCSIQEMSAHVEVSHSAISQVVSQLEKRGLLALHTTKSDQRRKEIRLTSRGKDLMKQVSPIWVAFEASFRHHMSENLLPMLDDMEDLLETGVISATALEHLHHEGSIETKYNELPGKEIIAFMKENNQPVNDRCAAISLQQSEVMLGVILFEVDNHEVVIRNLFVDPLYRRRGHARSMLTQLVQMYPSMRLRVDQVHKPIIHVLSELNHPFTVNPLTQE